MEPMRKLGGLMQWHIFIYQYAETSGIYCVCIHIIHMLFETCSLALSDILDMLTNDMFDPDKEQEGIEGIDY